MCTWATNSFRGGDAIGCHSLGEGKKDNLTPEKLMFCGLGKFFAENFSKLIIGFELKKDLHTIKKCQQKQGVHHTMDHVFFL